MVEFVIPDILQNRSTEDNHRKMKSIIPEDIDISEGSHEWNMTRPTAMLMAEMCEFILPSVIQVILPKWSYGTYLEGHAEERRLYRREATAASGEITITGDAGTVIPAGSLFSTAAVNGEPSVDYATEQAARILSGGYATIHVRCTQTGIVGNTPANTVVLLSSKLKGITSITNEEAITGGTEQEDDESLRARIAELDQEQGNSFVGNPADYRRWATSVAGVGAATIIPAHDDSGLVQIILTDSNGDPATTALCEEVYNYIMCPNDFNKRRAPIGALLSVSPPDAVKIGIKSTVELTDGATVESVKAAFLSRLNDYFATASKDGEIKYTRVAAALASTDGANDYTDLQIGVKTGDTVAYGTVNISISAAQFPTISGDDLILTAGTV